MKIISYVKEKIVHPGVQKHSKNMGWMFFARIGSMVITFLATAYIARNLGPTNYGQLSYAISFVALFGFLASLGIDAILQRDLIKYPEKRNEYLGSAIGIRVISSLLTIVICTTTAISLSAKDVSLLLIFIISLSPLLSSFQLLSYEFIAESKSKYPSILTLIVVTILNILKIVVIFLNGGVIYLALVVLAEPILYSLGYLYIKNKTYRDIKMLRFDKKISLSILKDSYPLILSTAFYAVSMRIDQVMLKNFLGAESVGLYDAAVRLSEVSYFIPQIMITSFLPSIINTRNTSTEIYNKRMKKLLIGLFSISILIALATTLLSKQLILVIFGSGFIGALPVLCIYVWSNIGATLNSFGQQVLISENKVKSISIMTFSGMIINVILNIILIPKYGMVGAAIATLISYSVPFLSIFLFRNTRKIMTNILSA